MNAKPAAIDEVLAHGQWLRRLAHALAKDDGDAQDLVQQTYLAVIESPPSTDRSVRPWLGRVLRNFARMGRRGQERRVERERNAGLGPEPLPGADDLLAQHRLLRVVAELVEQLDEPFRSTVLLCYGEDLSPSEVASRLGVPAATIRWRLMRARERLRAELDARHDGDRRAWAVLLLPCRSEQ
jgi:RNA polymerase sigma-70 factor (ECF subfamily)